IGAGHRRRALRPAVIGLSGGVVGHAGMLGRRAGPTTPAGSRTRVLTAPSRHTSILTHGGRGRAQATGVAVSRNGAAESELHENSAGRDETDRAGGYGGHDG